MPRPPRLRPPPPPWHRISYPTSQTASTSSSSSSSSLLLGKRPYTPTTTTTSSSSTAGYTSSSTAQPNLAWLANEIKRLAFPSPPSTTERQPHHPFYFPTPVFPLRGQDVTFLGEPAEFYETILERIRGATSRVTLSALYLGTGELERRMVQTLTDACQRRPGLRVRILLDHSRARRGGPGRDSLATLAPLLRACPRQVEVALFRMPQLTGPFGRRIPSPLNEVVAVSHLKALAFDDALLLTGANLSHDYFTQRQDRYVHIQNAGALAAFYHELVALLARFTSSTTTTYQNNTTQTDDAEPNADTTTCNTTLSSSSFVTLARELRRLWGQPPFSAFHDDIAGADTLALPTLQCAPLGIRHEQQLLLALLKAHAALASEGRLGPASPLELTLATAYLNPPPPLLETLAGWPGQLTLLAPAAAAHGFAGAEGLKSWIPLAYLMHEHRARQHLHHLRRGKGQDAGVHLFRYARPEWTFHGKGLWALPAREGAARGLSLTVAGSSNYGMRSLERDLESQVILLSRSPQLARSLARERSRLLQHAEAAGAIDAAAHDIERHLGPAMEYPWRRLWLPRLTEWTREFL